jgi:hypothetical protein
MCQKHLPHLPHCRQNPTFQASVIQDLPRKTTPQGIHIADMWVPGHVNALVSITTISHDICWLNQSNDFVHEHCTESKDEMAIDDAS